MLDTEIAVSDDDPLPLALQRKLDGLCPRCGDPAREDANLCAGCSERHVEHQQRLRDRRRGDGRCVYCGRRSSKRRCPRCTKTRRDQRRGVSKRARGDEQPDDRFRTVVEADSRYSAGRVRQRYVGRGTRGAPSREQLEADDVRWLEIASREVGKAIGKVRVANAMPADAPRIQRREARHEALAAAHVAWRLLAEILVRNGYEIEPAADGADE